MNIQFVKKSSNQKIGAIPCTTSARETCPKACPYAGVNGCYAEAGYYTRLNWDKVSSGERGAKYADLLDNIGKLKAKTLWRHNVAGDLMPDSRDSENIDSRALDLLATANTGKRGFTYTHYRDNAHNIKAIRSANRKGFTVNLSANTIDHAIELKRHNLPIAAVVPSDHGNDTRTIQGVKFITCPATYRDEVTCATCKLCSVSNRDSVVAFPAHGSRTNNANIIARG